jgi:hypothetical protein
VDLAANFANYANFLDWILRLTKPFWHSGIIVREG